MADEKKPDPEMSPEDAEHQRKMAALFDDIEDEDGEVIETVEGLRKERDDLLATVSRLSAGFATERQNLQRRAQEAGDSLKRTEAKAEQDKKYAIEKFIKELLPVVDTMELGLNAIKKQSSGEDPKYDKLAEGIEKTLGQLTTVFNKFGVKEINPLNQEFDPNEHDAITTQEKDGVEPETVIHVAQKGYKIEDRIIRPAKVIVTPPQ